MKAAALLLVAILSGCASYPALRQDRNPAPSSSMSREDAIYFSEGWFQSDKLNRRYIDLSNTGSMVPMYDSRTVLWIERLKGKPSRGDVVISYQGGELVCHPALEVRGEHAYISGINNHYSDGWIPLSSVQWRVVAAIYTKR